MVSTKRPESAGRRSSAGQKEEGRRVREERRASSSTATSTRGPGEESDAAVRSSTEEGFNVALVELAAEMERELALERTGDKPRTAIGSGRGGPARGLGGRRRRS